MLQTKNEFPGNVTLFEKFYDKKEGWGVKATRNEKVIKMTYCLNENHADTIRGIFVNEFWSHKLN